MHRYSTRKQRERFYPPPPEWPTDFTYGVPVFAPDDPTCQIYDRNYFGPPVRSYETEPPRKITAFRDAPVDTDTFLAVFPQFADANMYARTLVEVCFKRAWFYCAKFSQCDQLDGDDRLYAQMLMAAHILVLTKRQQAVAANPTGQIPGLPAGTQMVTGGYSITGQMGTTGMVSSASIGGESVSLTLPQSTNAWEYWLNQTPYGVEYQAFMSSHAPVGIYAEGDDLRMCLRD